MDCSGFSDFHVHSALSDGADTPEAIIERAIELGMPRLGLSEHGFAPYYADHSLDAQAQKDYIALMSRLKEKYRGRIRLFCGIEQEYSCPINAEGFDYVIGSVHYFMLDGDCCVVDGAPESILNAAEKHFGGDTLAVAEEYFRLVSDVCRATHCDIIGHFDLVSKLNEKYRLFDAHSDRYTAAWRSAADALVEYGVPFEINTGAISRGYTSVPYPAPEICRYLAERGAKFILSSDSHRKEDLCFGFDMWRERYAALGAEITEFHSMRNFIQ